MSMLTSSFMQSAAMATARDLFGSQSKQVLVKDEVAFKPALNPYQAIYDASERMNQGLDALLMTDLQPKQHDKEVVVDDRLLPAHV